MQIKFQMPTREAIRERLEKPVTLKQLLGILLLFFAFTAVALQFIMLPEFNSQLNRIFSAEDMKIQSQLNTTNTALQALSVADTLSSANVQSNLLGLIVLTNPKLLDTQIRFENDISNYTEFLNTTCLPFNALQKFQYTLDYNRRKITDATVSFYSPISPYSLMVTYYLNETGYVLDFITCGVKHSG